MKMNSQKQVVVRDLVEEGKRRIVFLGICVVGLSYLMSLTSSSVWVNLPAAASLIVILRYLSLDFEMRRKAAAYNNRSSSANTLAQKKPFTSPKDVKKSDWRSKVNSPVVEDAINNFSSHLISEWVTDLWYSRLTPDKEGPEELIQIINGVLGEISNRMKNINLINLLTRDLVTLICTHLEFFRASQAKIENFSMLDMENRDMELRLVLASQNKLHPALFSAEAEHKVLQHMMDGLISFTFRPEDLQCSFFRYIVRELLSCAVMRPVLNLASPRFINERIESVVVSRNTANKGTTSSQEALKSKPNGLSRISPDHFSKFMDPSIGVELVQMKNSQSRNAVDTSAADNLNGRHNSKDPLLSIDTRSCHSWSSLPFNSQTIDGKPVERQRSGGEWGDMLDMISRRKTAVLAPENFENMWAKGRNYKKKERENRFIEKTLPTSLDGKHVNVDQLKVPVKSKEKNIITKASSPNSGDILSGLGEHSRLENYGHIKGNSMPSHTSVTSHHEGLHMDDVESRSSNYTSEDEETIAVTGIGSPGTKVWDGRSNRNLGASHIHHPLEISEGNMRKKTGREHVHYHKMPRVQSGSKRSRSSGMHVWQEVERTSFLSGDGQDILRSSKHQAKSEDSSEDSESEVLGRVHSGASGFSSAFSITTPETHNMTVNSLQKSMVVDSFFRLKCEVLGANIVKSGSKTFAVYSISVTDVNKNCWSIKRRFRHFEELHRRLKLFPEYNLHLPPKHFLSTGLDIPVIRERCILLDKYLKKLLQLPTISGSLEVWDFLSVDSQTYIFFNSFSIIETLSVNLDEKPSENSKILSKFETPVIDPLSPGRDKDSLQMKHNLMKDGFGLNAKDISRSPVKRTGKERGNSIVDSGSDSDGMFQKNASSIKNLGKSAQGKDSGGHENASEVHLDGDTDPSLPTEWVPPNLSIPILDLVDVIFQLQDGGWIRRQAFWVAKQILHLGMGDAFDDWLIEKIQLLRKGSVVASGIKRVEQILWPDGIFITKHPKRQRQPPATNMSPRLPNGGQPAEISSPRMTDDEQQQEEAVRRAKFVYELMIDNPPAAIVSLVGRKEYEQCAKDLYFFLQSSVCLKQLAYDLLELLLVSAFPELEHVLKQVHEEKQKFGVFVANR